MDAEGESDNEGGPDNLPVIEADVRALRRSTSDKRLVSVTDPLQMFGDLLKLPADESKFVHARFRSRLPMGTRLT